jgi:hypothetical protein
MKKVVLTIALAIGMALTTQAQVNPHALGLRFGGDGTTNGAELSYQHGFGDKNRLELDLGVRSRRHFNQTQISGIYHWVWNLDGGLNWYIGPGATLGFYNWDDGRNTSSGIALGLGGQIGLEYDFNKIGAPLLLSLDTRPMFDFAGYTNGFGWGAALGLRYTW